MSVRFSHKVGELVVAGCLLATGLTSVVLSLGLDYRAQFGRPGPGFLPLWAGVLLTVTGLALVASSATALARGGHGAAVAVPQPEAAISNPQPDDTDGSPAPPTSEHNVQAARKMLLVFVLLVLWVTFVRTGGFMTSTFIFLLAIFLLVERVSVIRSLTVAVVCTLVLYGIFDLLLEVPLPRGYLV